VRGAARLLGIVLVLAWVLRSISWGRAGGYVSNSCKATEYKASKHLKAHTKRHLDVDKLSGRYGK